MIRTERLTKSYGYHDALRELDLEVRRGEFLVLFGPNGAGKTTLLKLLAGLMRPTSGRVALGGDGDGPTRIGYVSHATFLYNRLTGRENLTYYARLYAVPDADRRVEELGARVRLADRLDDPVQAYSRGMRQRLSIARALINDPEVLLLDEPFTGLDPAAGDRLAEQLASWATAGRAAVMVSHELQRGLALATRVAILDRGRFVLESPAATIDPTDFADTYRRCLRKGDA